MESVEAMKKILSALVVILLASSAPVFACATNETGITTGSACSIDELNSNNNLEKVKAKPEKVKPTILKSQRNLRPVRFQASISNPKGCPELICLNRILLGNPLEGFGK